MLPFPAKVQREIDKSTQNYNRISIIAAVAFVALLIPGVIFVSDDLAFKSDTNLPNEEGLVHLSAQANANGNYHDAAYYADQSLSEQPSIGGFIQAREAYSHLPSYSLLLPEKSSLITIESHPENVATFHPDKSNVGYVIPKDNESFQLDYPGSVPIVYPVNGAYPIIIFDKNNLDAAPIVVSPDGPTYSEIISQVNLDNHIVIQPTYHADPEGLVAYAESPFAGPTDPIAIYPYGFAGDAPPVIVFPNQSDAPAVSINPGENQQNPGPSTSSQIRVIHGGGGEQPQRQQVITSQDLTFIEYVQVAPSEIGSGISNINRPVITFPYGPDSQSVGFPLGPDFRPMIFLLPSNAGSTTTDTNNNNNANTNTNNNNNANTNTNNNNNANTNTNTGSTTTDASVSIGSTQADTVISNTGPTFNSDPNSQFGAGPGTLVITSGAFDDDVSTGDNGSTSGGFGTGYSGSDSVSYSGGDSVGGFGAGFGIGGFGSGFIGGGGGDFVGAGFGNDRLFSDEMLDLEIDALFLDQPFSEEMYAGLDIVPSGDPIAFSLDGDACTVRREMGSHESTYWNFNLYATNPPIMLNMDRNLCDGTYIFGIDRNGNGILDSGYEIMWLREFDAFQLLQNVDYYGGGPYDGLFDADDPLWADALVMDSDYNYYHPEELGIRAVDYHNSDIQRFGNDEHGVGVYADEVSVSDAHFRILVHAPDAIIFDDDSTTEAFGIVEGPLWDCTIHDVRYHVAEKMTGLYLRSGEDDPEDSTQLYLDALDFCDDFEEANKHPDKYLSHWVAGIASMEHKKGLTDFSLLLQSKETYEQALLMAPDNPFYDVDYCLVNKQLGYPIDHCIPNVQQAIEDRPDVAWFQQVHVILTGDAYRQES